MGIKRIVNTEVWTDEKTETFSPEDRYFWLYLLTNPYTTQLGIYKITVKQAAFQLGYSQDSVLVLLDRFERKYGLIKYLDGEIAIKNYLRHSIIKGGKPVEDCLMRDVATVKHRELIDWVFGEIRGDLNLNDTVKRVITKYSNDNDNDNDVSLLRYVHDTYHDTSTCRTPKIDLEQHFDEFWSEYPNKKSKESARKSWLKLKVDDNLFKEIMDGLSKAKQSRQWTKDGGQYIPHPSTWLNQKRWNDEYDEGRTAEGRVIDNERINGIDF